MISFESAGGKRHFSTSLPTLAVLRVFSMGLKRQPAGSWLYVGQSAGLLFCASAATSADVHMKTQSSASMALHLLLIMWTAPFTALGTRAFVLPTLPICLPARALSEDL